MSQVLLRVGAFGALILFAYGLKAAGVLRPGDHRVLSKLLTTLTLPAAVVVSFSSFTLEPSLAFLAGLALALNLGAALLGWLLARGRGNGERAFAMLNLSGYNVGAFAMPFLQSFLGPAAVGVACVFDVGNSVMCTGGTYALAGVLAPTGGEKATLGRAAKQLFSSITFDVYLLMFLLSLGGFEVPQGVVDFLSPASSANPCLAMLMIGLMVEWDLKPGYLRRALLLVAGRNLLALGAALAFYFFAPFSLEVRQVMAILLFAPISVVNTAFTEKAGCDPGFAGFASSLSILVSFFTMSLAVVLLGAAG